MKEKKSIQGIGIDVSKQQLDISLVLGKKNIIEHFVVENSIKGINKLMKRISDFAEKIVMESTGRYHFLVAFTLAQAGYDVRVVNPLLARKYLSASIRNNKTDKADSKILGEMAIVEKALPASFNLSKIDIQLRQKMGLMASLEKQIQQFKAVMRDYNFFQEKISITSSEAEDALSDTLKTLEKCKKALEKEFQDIIQESKKDLNDSKCHHALLISIPGVSSFAASLIVQFLDTSVNSAKSWIAYIGMDIAARQSGTWKGKGRLSKRGNPYLRKRLFGVAWGSVMTNAQFKSYYYDLKERGLKHVEALLTIARKILKITFVLLKKNIFYNEKICFSS